MSKTNTKEITRAGILLAILVVFQSLRLFIPLPPFLSIFIIGSLVNLVLIFAVDWIMFWPTAVIALLAPVIAYFQGFLFLPVFIMPIAIGNWIFIGAYFRLKSFGRAAIIVAALFKTIFLFIAFTFLLKMLALPAKITTSLLFVMSWPQLVTGVLGGLFASLLTKKMPK